MKHLPLLLFSFLILGLGNVFGLNYKDSLINIAQNKELLNSSQRANALLELSKFCWTSDSDSAISMSYDVILIGENIGDQQLIGDAYYNLGMIAYVNESFEQAFGHFFNAAETYDEEKSSFQNVLSKYQASICLKEMGQTKDALNIMEEALEVASNSNSVNLSYSIAFELGELYALNKDTSLAEKYYKESIKIAEVNEDSTSLLDAKVRLGQFYRSIEEVTKSINVFSNALKLIHPVDKALLSKIYNELGSSYLLNNNLDNALQYFNLALLTSNESKSIAMQALSHFNLSKLYEMQQQYALALIEYKLYDGYNDSISLALQNSNSLSGLQAKFDNVAKDKEIKLKDLEMSQSKAESELEIKNQRLQNLFIISGLGLAILVGFVILIALRRQRVLNKKLDQLSMVAREIENIVIIADGDGEVEWVNESYERNFGIGLEGFKEKFGSNILENPPNQDFVDKVKEALTEKKTVQYYLSNKDKNGKIRHVKTTLTPKIAADGSVDKLILIDTDISDLIIAEQQLTKQRDKLSGVYSQITDSIDYAKRIQNAVLPHRLKISKFTKEHYLFYQPKDGVSGDFYFIEENEYYVYFAGADCTGHGVPGALMSVICHNLLENAVHRHTETNEILFELNRQLIRKLKQGVDKEEHIKDGLDIALIRVRKDELSKPEKTIQYSGAHSPLYILNESNFKELKPNKIHLGESIETIDLIEVQELVLKEGSELVFFSDGFADQKGGSKGKKYYYAPFRELIQTVNKLPQKEKQDYLKKTFNKWKVGKEQADDVFVWGIKI